MMPISSQQHTHAETHVSRDHEARTVFGVWIYIMSDCILFATLFATYAVLRNNTFGGPGPAELFSLPFVLVETLLLLTSSFTYGLALLAAQAGKTHATLTWLKATFLLGAAFIALELYEFTELISAGHSFTESAFLSAFFALVGTHGLHVFAGLVWMVLIMNQIGVRGITMTMSRKIACLGLFWHFLDIVWIFIFSIVYLLGML